MLTSQKTAEHAKATTSAAESIEPNTVYFQCETSLFLRKRQFYFSKFLIKICTYFFGIQLFMVMVLSNAFAEDAKARWYRYYNTQGIPTLSSTISEQHLQYGYDSLDKNMRPIHHFPPFSGQKYIQEQAQREQAIAKRISERHLQETYVSTSRATIQRDREVSGIDDQINRGQQQSTTLSTALNESITLAANLERQNKSIPLSLKNQLKTNKDLLNQSLANVAALKIKREQTSKQFNDAIATLKIIEQRKSKPTTPVTSPITTYK